MRLRAAISLVTDRDLLTFVAIRVGIWILVAFTLLWAPLRSEETNPFVPRVTTA